MTLAEKTPAFLERIQDARVRQAFAEDCHLLVCRRCGTQYSVTDATELSPPNECPSCEDERQYVPADGQKWTTMAEWLDGDAGAKTQSTLEPDTDEPRVFRVTVKGYSISNGQTPMVIVTQHGIAIWDCNAVLMPQIVDAIHSLQHVYGNLPLLGIAISHPHFYTTGMTWAKALNTKVIISSSDKEWWQRTRGKRNDDEAQRLVFFDEERYTMAKGLTIVRCGGHFDGSTILHWDRAKASGPTGFEGKGVRLPSTGAVFCSDTFAPTASGRFLTFMWSYPNYIPLPARDVQHIWQVMSAFDFEDIIAGWPGRNMLGDARKKLLVSARRFVQMEGHNENAFDWGSPQFSLSGTDLGRFALSYEY